MSRPFERAEGLSTHVCGSIGRPSKGCKNCSADQGRADWRTNWEYCPPSLDVRIEAIEDYLEELGQ